MQNESPISSGLKIIVKIKVFFKVGQTSRSRSQGQKLWYQVEGLAKVDTHVPYESPITSGFKVMTKVKFLSAYYTPTQTRQDTDARAMILAPWTYMSRPAKK